MLIPLIVLAGTYAALCGLAFILADRLMFQPPPNVSGPAEDFVTLTTADGVRIAALYLPNPAAAYTILYSHGNAEDLHWIRWVLERLRNAGFSVLAYDYRGYGAGSGRPTAAGTLLDIDAAYAHAINELNVPPERILLHGRSIGSGPTLDLAAREPVAGVILESAFTSAFRTLTRVPLLPFDRYPNIRRIRRVHVPVLVIHGRADAIIPVRHGELLYEAAPGAKLSFWVDGAGHNDLVSVAGPRYEETLRAFEALVRDAARARDAHDSPIRRTDP